MRAPVVSSVARQPEVTGAWSAARPKQTAKSPSQVAALPRAQERPPATRSQDRAPVPRAQQKAPLKVPVAKTAPMVRDFSKTTNPFEEHSEPVTTGSNPFEEPSPTSDYPKEYNPFD